MTIGGSNNIDLTGSITGDTGAATRLLAITNSGATTISGNIYLSDSSTAGRTLAVSGTTAVAISGVISNYNGAGGTAGNLTYSGSSTLTLQSASTYTGTTSISNGNLTLTGTNARLGSGNVSVTETSLTTTATLTISTGVADAIADTATLSLTSFKTGGANYATVSLGSGVVETIGGLNFDGAAQIAGTWGATGSGADNINDNWFAGSGVLLVVPELST